MGTYGVATYGVGTYGGPDTPEDAGLTGVHWEAGRLVPESAALKRFHHVARGYLYEDVEVVVEHGNDAAPGAAYRVGATARRLSPSNYLRAVSSPTELRLEKVDGGVPSTLAAPVVLPGMVNGDPYWTVLRTEGDDIYAEWWDSEPTPMSAPDHVVATTLAGADAAKFGAGAGGFAGVYWIPGANWATAWLERFSARPYTYRGRALPEVVQLGGAIPGDVPALCDLELTPAGGADPPIFATVGWTERPPASEVGGIPPVGILEAEDADAGTLLVWADDADAAYRGGHALVGAVAGIETLRAEWLIDPALLVGEEFMDEVAISFLGRLLVDADAIAPTAILSAAPAHGLTAGRRYADEFQAAGHPLVKPDTAAAWRPAHLGSMRLPVDRDRPALWRLRLDYTTGPGSSGQAGIDYLFAAPLRKQASSPTGLPDDAAYPRFVQQTGETRKVVHADGSGAVAPPIGNPAPDYGLDGPLELPPGDVDLAVKLSSLVPDDPTVDDDAEQLAHAATVHVSIVPRAFLGRDG